MSNDTDIVNEQAAAGIADAQDDGGGVTLAGPSDTVATGTSDPVPVPAPPAAEAKPASVAPVPAKPHPVPTAAQPGAAYELVFNGGSDGAAQVSSLADLPEQVARFMLTGRKLRALTVRITALLEHKPKSTKATRIDGVE